MPNTEPIFIVACPRSGTTVLASILNRHPNIATATETHFFNHISKLKCFKYFNKKDIEKFIQEMNKQMRIEDFCGLSGISKDELADLIRKIDDFSSPNSFFEKLMQVFLEKKSKVRFCEKTPQHLQNVEDILREYPNARIIHLIRDGRDTVNSLLKMPWRPNGILNNARFWMHYIDVSQRLKSRLENNGQKDSILNIRYEDLLLKPKQIMQEICTFIGEDFHDYMLQPTHDKDEEIFSDWESDWKHKARLDIDSTRIAAWKRELTEDEQIILTDLLRSRLEQLGYQTNEPRPLIKHKLQIFSEYMEIVFRKISRFLTSLFTFRFAN